MVQESNPEGLGKRRIGFTQEVWVVRMEPDNNYARATEKLVCIRVTWWACYSTDSWAPPWDILILQRSGVGLTNLHFCKCPWDTVITGPWTKFWGKTLRGLPALKSPELFSRFKNIWTFKGRHLATKLERGLSGQRKATSWQTKHMIWEAPQQSGQLHIKTKWDLIKKIFFGSSSLQEMRLMVIWRKVRERGRPKQALHRRYLFGNWICQAGRWGGPAHPIIHCSSSPHWKHVSLSGANCSHLILKPLPQLFWGLLEMGMKDFVALVKRKKKNRWR